MITNFHNFIFICGKIQKRTMLFGSKIRTLHYAFGYYNYSLKNLVQIQHTGIAQFSSGRNLAKRIDFDQLIVPSRYADVPISDKPYFDFVWENKEKHLDKVAVVSSNFEIGCLLSLTS